MNGSKRAFTLIELLVVIAILSILAAMLFPVFAQVREKARAADCTSNMRQIGLAAGMYFADYDGQLYFHHAGLEEVFWKEVFAPYLRSERIGVCRSDPATAPVDPNSGRIERPSYLINAYFTHNSPPEDEAAPIPLNKYGQDDARLVSPSDTVLFCESGITDPGHNQDDYDAWNGVDGRVAWRRYDRVKHMHFPDHRIIP